MNKASKNLENLYEELGNLEVDFRNNNLYSLVLSRAKGRTFLDIGCGAGHLLAKAKKIGMIVRGLEKDRNLIKLSKKIYGKRIPIIQIQAEEIHNLDKRFDTITMIDVLEHIDKDELVLKKIIKKISEKGRLVIIVPAFKFLYSDRDRLYGHKRRYGKKELYEKLEKCGYEVKELRYWNILGFVAYLFYEKILNKRISLENRSKKPKGIAGKLSHKIVDQWMKSIENNIDFGIGLSLLCVAIPREGKVN